MTVIDHKSTIVGTCTVTKPIDCSNIETDTYEQCETCDRQRVDGKDIGHSHRFVQIPHNVDYMASVEGSELVYCGLCFRIQ
jgi:hypothetical protein